MLSGAGPRGTRGSRATHSPVPPPQFRVLVAYTSRLRICAEAKSMAATVTTIMKMIKPAAPY